MVELYATSASEAALPLKIGGVSVAEVATSLFLVAPFKGKFTQAATVLNTQMGLEWPAVHELKRMGGAYVLWFDHAHIAFMGAEPSVELARYAAVTDVSDACCIIDISGVSVRNVLARVTPLDVRAKSFNIGMTQRSMVMHMQASCCARSSRLCAARRSSPCAGAGCSTRSWCVLLQPMVPTPSTCAMR